MSANAKDSIEPLLILGADHDADLLQQFVSEGQEHLVNIEQGVLTLEENPHDAETLNSIFRAFHTFKGGSGFLNLTAIQNLAHELESLLDLARQQKLAITPSLITLILEGGDTLKAFASEISTYLASGKTEGTILIPTLDLLGRIREALTGTTTATVVSETRARNGSVKAVATTNTVKVDTAKLDNLVDMVGELVIAQSQVSQNPALAQISSEQLTRNLAQLGRIMKELQRTAMSLRMVPIRPTFQKMSRLVRDVSAKLSKQITLVMDGEDTEMDRTIVEEISDPLIHMVRNSVDHGIELPAARAKNGKPANGTVTLRAFHQGGNIVIEVKDDGKGLDRERIRAKAVERGIVAPNETLSESQIFNLIFAAGFSTAEEVSDLSGRGVGMDVVRRNIEKLRGKIEIESLPGLGSTFRIHLPLTLAIIDGLLVGVGQHRYILPTLLVRESFRFDRARFHTVHERGELMEVRDRLLPLVRVSELFGITAERADEQSIVIVVEVGSDARCLLVDTLLGKQEVVVKSLGELLHGNPYLSGAAILGDGRVGLILDPQTLLAPKTTTLQAAA
jgi:two-component system chemotaxis sensor kinase CheA